MYIIAKIPFLPPLNQITTIKIGNSLRKYTKPLTVEVFRTGNNFLPFYFYAFIILFFAKEIHCFLKV